MLHSQCQAWLVKGDLMSGWRTVGGSRRSLSLGLFAALSVALVAGCASSDDEAGAPRRVAASEPESANGRFSGPEEPTQASYPMQRYAFTTVEEITATSDLVLQGRVAEVVVVTAPDGSGRRLLLVDPDEVFRGSPVEGGWEAFSTAMTEWGSEAALYAVAALGQSDELIPIFDQNVVDSEGDGHLQEGQIWLNAGDEGIFFLTKLNEVGAYGPIAAGGSLKVEGTALVGPDEEPGQVAPQLESLGTAGAVAALQEVGERADRGEIQPIKTLAELNLDYLREGLGSASTVASADSAH
jgi:hypothetical protein